jgi:hypothetical protein
MPNVIDEEVVDKGEDDENVYIAVDDAVDDSIDDDSDAVTEHEPDDGEEIDDLTTF